MTQSHRCVRISGLVALGLLIPLTASGQSEPPPRTPASFPESSALPLAADAAVPRVSVPPSDSVVHRGIDGDLRVEPPRIDDPDISLDGRLDEPEWQTAAILSGFSQYEPTERIPATQNTEVRVFYSADAIYFGIRAQDSEPERILARLGERDRAAFSDDWVRLMIDTFDDQRQAYVFYVNPFGIQTDGLWIEGMDRRGSVSIDFNPDFIWQSNGRLNEEGWAAEIRIPYVTLRFRESPEQRWGFNVAREVQRFGFKQSWAPLTANISNTLAQSGKLTGMRDISPKRLVEINPEAWGRLPGERVDGDFVHSNMKPELGVNGRVAITPNLVLDGTYNPDFSQVEADADQVRVNERFALFLPEKRPFFLEGTEIFNTPERLVYTRQIADPDVGAKLTGKVGSFNLGYLGSLDDGPVSLFGGDDRALFNLLRMRRDVGDGSTVGALYTDRTLESGAGYNRVISGDTRVQMGSAHVLTVQASGSWDQSGDDAAQTWGSMVSARFQRSGRDLAYNLRFLDITPDFRARSGFIPRVDVTQAFASGSYTWYNPPGSRLERYGAEVRVDSYFDHDEFWQGQGPEEAELELQPNFFFRGSRSVSAIFRLGYFRFQQDDYSDYQVRQEDGTLVPYRIPEPLTAMLAFGGIPRVRLTDAAQLNGLLFFREVPLYAEGSQGLEFQVAPDLQLRLTTQTLLELKHTYSRIIRSEGGAVYSTANLSRVKAQFQFTKALLARVILQYNLQERDRLIDPTTGGQIFIDGVEAVEVSGGTFGGQVLTSYEPSPGTIFYIGYSRQMVGPATYAPSRMEPVGDAFFLKLSYLFRL